MINLFFALLTVGSYCDAMKHDSFYLNKYRQKTVCQNIQLLEEETGKHNIRVSLMVSLIYVESGWKKTVVSSANACGLTQVIPKYTGGPWSDGKKYTCSQLKNPKTSIKVGTRVLRWWIDWHTKNQPKKKYTDEQILKRALCSYNAGFSCSGKKPSRGGIRYAKKVLKFENKIINILTK